MIPNAVSGARGQGAAGGSGSGANPTAAQAGAALAASLAPPAPTGRTCVYVSGFDDEITVYQFDPRTGALARAGAVKAGENASYLAASPDRRFLFALNETDASRVIPFRITPATGLPSRIDEGQATGGAATTHLAVHPTGRWLVAASYGSGTVTLFAIGDDGRLERVGDPLKPNGDGERAHQIVFDRGGAHLLVPCLGSEFVAQLGFEAGALVANQPAAARVTKTANPAASRIGPRHLALDPAQRFAYVIGELSSDLSWFRYDAATGLLSEEKVIKGTVVPGASAHLVVHPSGRFLYASHRTGNSLALYALADDGAPTLVIEERAHVANPRDFALDSSGRWLIAANQNDGKLLVYEVDRATGRLTRRQIVARGGAPTFVGFLGLP